MSGIFFRLLTAVWLLGLGGCSTYQKRWEAAALATPAKDTVAGAYAGTWQSDGGAFGGKLWCIVEPVTGPGKTYRAQFRATWHRVFSSEHEILIHGQSLSRGGVKFRERAEIKTWIGSGSYECVGEMRRGEFLARYEASYDQGTFKMVRPKKNREEQGRHLVRR